MFNLFMYVNGTARMFTAFTNWFGSLLVNRYYERPNDVVKNVVYLWVWDYMTTLTLMDKVSGGRYYYQFINIDGVLSFGGEESPSIDILWKSCYEKSPDSGAMFKYFSNLP